MVIFTYSNTLLSVSLINMSGWACECAAEKGHLDCLKYLHETAKAPWDEDAVYTHTRTTTPNVYNTSSTTTVLSHLVGLTKAERYTTSSTIRKKKKKNSSPDGAYQV